MKIRDTVRAKVVERLKELSYRETAYLYRRHKLDYTNYINRIQYPQTWWMKKYIPLNLCRRWIIYKGKCLHNPLYYILTSLCGLLTGHEKSATEYGYGGGDYIDRNCRWCDKVILEPIEESRWAKDGPLSEIVETMRDGRTQVISDLDDEPNAA